MPTRSRERGISVIEVVIIVTIVGVLAAIIVPNIVEATQSYNIRIAADALGQQLNRCRQEAVRANLPIEIKVTETTTSIDLDRDGDFTNDGATVTVASDAAITIVEPEDGEVEYSSRGEMKLGISPEFRVVNGNRFRKVTVDPRGAVTIHAEESL